jgi:hypothetical protein
LSADQSASEEQHKLYLEYTALSTAACNEEMRQNNKPLSFARKNIPQEFSAKFIYRVKRQKKPNKFFDPPLNELFHIFSR